ncbi:osmotically inducible protein OsmC [Streptomyces lunaelactis]|uniref:Osmotically inducible protein OsmC n=1 Tax=Streptomyces lunaelactis TaxID=1535768 RepID=A0A2R4TC82_9ACTN|nr:osmotically inducible protein OsmC [Streptomyces lunaelactis]NUK87864.1 OsmC family protein [Streptomyces lunaelactis]
MDDQARAGGGAALRSGAAAPQGRIDVTHVSGQSYAVFVRDHELTVDQPVDAGGSDEGPTPVELFVSSLASCAAYYAGRFLERQHLPNESLRVRAEFDMADDRPARVSAVRMRIELPEEIGTVRRRSLLAVVDHCTVHNSLRVPPEVSVGVG